MAPGTSTLLLEKAVLHEETTKQRRCVWQIPGEFLLLDHVATHTDCALQGMCACRGLKNC
jgi:hypothetical protein